MIRIFGYQGAEKGDEGFFVPLYKNNAKNQKSSRKIFDFGKIFFRATRMVILLLYGVPEKHPEYGRFLYLRQLYENSAGTVITNTKPKEKVEPRLHFLFFRP